MIASSRKRQAIPAKKMIASSRKKQAVLGELFLFSSDFEVFKYIWITFQTFPLSMMTKKLFSVGQKQYN